MGNFTIYKVNSIPYSNFIVYIGKFFIYRVTSLIVIIVYTIERRSLAGILTPTVREFWRAYIEKTRETTSTIATPYIEASCDPYTNSTMAPTPAHYQFTYYPYIETTSPTTSPATRLPPTLTPYTYWTTPTPTTLTPTLPNLLPLLPPYYPSHSPWRGASPLSPSALRARDPLSPFPKF